MALPNAAVWRVHCSGDKLPGGLVPIFCLTIGLQSSSWVRGCRLRPRINPSTRASTAIWAGTPTPTASARKQPAACSTGKHGTECQDDRQRPPHVLAPIRGPRPDHVDGGHPAGILPLDHAQDADQQGSCRSERGTCSTRGMWRTGGMGSGGRRKYNVAASV